MGTRRGISDRSPIGMGAPARPEGSSPGILRDHRNGILDRAVADSFDLAGLGRERGCRETVTAYMTLAWTATLSAAVVDACRRKLPAYKTAATVMIVKLTGRVGAS